MMALADAINVFNDEDALELFKKILLSSANSFMQMKVIVDTMRQQAARIQKSSKLANHVST